MTQPRYLGNRRHILKWGAGLLGSAAFSTPAAAAVKTPSQVEGPFYPTPEMRHADIDNDLVRIAGVVRDAGGHIIQLQGRVLTSTGQPVSNARVEIWQCDMNGRYMHRSDAARGPHDPAFQGFGHDITDDQGHYAFRTIAPVPYPGRAPHIHMKILTQGLALTTQLYIAGEPANDSDRIFRRLSREQQDALLMRFRKTGGVTLANMDIVV